MSNQLQRLLEELDAERGLRAAEQQRRLRAEAEMVQLRAALEVARHAASLPGGEAAAGSPEGATPRHPMAATPPQVTVLRALSAAMWGVLLRNCVPASSAAAAKAATGRSVAAASHTRLQQLREASLDAAGR